MKAMVFAAGYGSRLGDLTKSKPKCLIDIGDKTILEIILLRLKGSGVTSVMINLFYLKEMIKEYLIRHDNFGLDIHFSEEAELLGTGGGLKKVRSFFENEPYFIVHNSDVYSTIDLSGLVAFHKEKRALASLAVMDRPTSRVLLFDQSGMLSGWENAKEGRGDVFGPDSELTPLAFSGIQALSPKVFDYMEEEAASFSTITSFVKAAKKGERVLAYRMDGAYWIDMGSPEKLAELRSILAVKNEMH